MQDVYNIMKPVFEGPIFKAALREASLFRQVHVAAAVRKESDSSTRGLQTIRAAQQFTTAIIEAMVVEHVPDEVIQGLGFHSFLFFGINPNLYSMAILAVNGVEEYSEERVDEILKEHSKVSLDDILRGEENSMDILIWMYHIGNNLATYLMKCHQG